MLLYKICLFLILFLCRLLYDINYLYKNCIIKYGWFNVLIISIVHSLITTILSLGWMFDIHITNFIVILGLGVFIGWNLFGNCIVTIEINKLCNDDVLHTDYYPKNCINLSRIIIIGFLYVYKYLKYFCII